MEILRVLGRGRQAEFELVRYKGELYAKSWKYSPLPPCHNLPHVVNTQVMDGHYLWELCDTIPETEGLDPALHLDYEIRIRMQMIAARFELASMCIVPEENQYMLSTKDYRVKQMDLDGRTHRLKTATGYNGPYDLEEIYQSSIQGILYPSDLVWIGAIPSERVSYDVVKSLDPEKMLRLYCRKVYERYHTVKYSLDDFTYDFPDIDLNADLRVVVFSLINALETYVFPKQTEILDHLMQRKPKRKRVDV